MSAPRILVLSTYYHPVVGGSETNARQLAQYLHARGFGVRVLTKRVGDASPEDTVDGIAVLRVGPSAPRTSAQKWLMLPAIFWAMIRHRREYDLVFSPDYRGIGIAGILAARLLGRRSAMGTQALGVISAENLDPLLSKLRLNPLGRIAAICKWPLRTIYGMADAYPAITHAIEREALGCGVPASRVHYLPNSVDLERFRPPAAGERAQWRESLAWPLDRVICLFMARLSLEKGLLDLLAAWRELSDPAALLCVVGPDMTGHSFDIGPAARAFVAEHGLGDRVRFAGATAAPERMLRAADFLAQPSHWEAAPFGVIEAMASGLPVVATRVGGMAEYLTEDVNALLCSPHDPRGLAQQLHRMMADADLRHRLGEAGRATAAREFDQAAVCARYAELFISLAGKRDTRS